MKIKKPKNLSTLLFRLFFKTGLDSPDLIVQTFNGSQLMIAKTWNIQYRAIRVGKGERKAELCITHFLSVSACECVIFDGRDKVYGTFTSPNYPQVYPTNINCILYTFIAQPQKIVELTFEAFDLPFPLTTKYAYDYTSLDKTTCVSVCVFVCLSVCVWLSFLLAGCCFLASFFRTLFPRFP